MNFFKTDNYFWSNTKTLINRSYICGYCGDKVSSDKGYSIVPSQNTVATGIFGGLYLCPSCNGPTFFTPHKNQIPGTLIGKSVDDVPQELNQLYEEARKCFSQDCYTAVVMLCRKMLMNIAVIKGADKNIRFVDYVEYLAKNNYIPPDGKEWVDHIRSKGNEANHEMKSMDQNDARNLLIFIEMLLKVIFEFPNMMKYKD